MPETSQTPADIDKLHRSVNCLRLELPQTVADAALPPLHDALAELAAYRVLAAAAEEVIKSNIGWRRSIDVATVSHGSLDGLSAALAAVRTGETK